MRFFGLLMICGAMFAFFSAWKGVNEALPQLIADESLRDAVTRCVADAGTMLTIGICVIGLAVWCLAESQSRQLVRHVKEREELILNYVDRKVGELRKEIAEDGKFTREWVKQFIGPNGEKLQRLFATVAIMNDLSPKKMEVYRRLSIREANCWLPDLEKERRFPDGTVSPIQ